MAEQDRRPAGIRPPSTGVDLERSKSMHQRFKSGVLAALTVAAVLSVGSPVRAQDDEVVLRPPSASGRPGEIVTVDFRGDVPVPLAHYLIGFNIDRAVVEFLGTEVEGTIVDGIAPRAIFSVDDKDVETILIGANPEQSKNLGRTRTGRNLILIRAKLRVRPDAPVGDHPLVIENNKIVTLFAKLGSIPVDYRIDLSVPGVFTVKPPDGPRPIGDLICAQDGAEMIVSWTNTEAYDEISVSRNGVKVATLEGAATSHADTPSIGPVSYVVVARSGAKDSIPISCQVLMETPRPDAVRNLRCPVVDGAVRLSWENGAQYQTVTVLKNGRVIGALAADSQTIADSPAPELFAVYSVRGSVDGVESFAVSCKVNEFSDVFRFRGEAVAARAGQAGVRVPIYATNPQTVRGFSVAFRIDPTAATIRDVEIDGTRTEAFSPDFFSFNAVEETGEVGIGTVFDFFEDDYYTAAADQHVLTVVVDVERNVEDGSQIAVEFGLFGSPKVITSFTRVKPVMEILPETVDGAILVGQSPLAPVQAVAAQEVEEGAAAVLGREKQIPGQPNASTAKSSTPIPFRSIAT